jgi:hypothetical protein
MINIVKLVDCPSCDGVLLNKKEKPRIMLDLLHRTVYAQSYYACTVRFFPRLSPLVLRFIYLFIYLFNLFVSHTLQTLQSQSTKLHHVETRTKGCALIRALTYKYAD